MSIQFASHDSRQARVADKQIVVEPDSNRKGLEEFGKVQELPKHQARRDSLSESSSGFAHGMASHATWIAKMWASALET